MQLYEMSKFPLGVESSLDLTVTNELIDKRQLNFVVCFN